MVEEVVDAEPSRRVADPGRGEHPHGLLHRPARERLEAQLVQVRRQGVAAVGVDQQVGRRRGRRRQHVGLLRVVGEQRGERGGARGTHGEADGTGGRTVVGAGRDPSGAHAEDGPVVHGSADALPRCDPSQDAVHDVELRHHPDLVVAAVARRLAGTGPTELVEVLVERLPERTIGKGVVGGERIPADDDVAEGPPTGAVEVVVEREPVADVVVDRRPRHLAA